MLRRQIKLAWGYFHLMGHWPLTDSKLVVRHLSGRIDVGTRLDENEVGALAPRSYFRRTKDPEKVLILNQFLQDDHAANA